MSWTRQTFTALCSTGIVVSSFLVIFAALADGTVYVTFVKKLLAPDGEANDRFGYVHSVDGDRLAVSALGDDDVGADAGSVTVFERNAGGVNNWGAVAKFVASDGADDDRFGQGLSLAGDVLFVGPFNYETPKPGAAYVFDLRGPPGAWGEVARLVPSDGTVNDFFGRFLATNGEIALIGAFGEDSAASDSGAVYLFEGDPGDPGVWAETHKLKAPVPDANDFFGRRFGFDDSSVVVAAFKDDDNGTDAGAAYVFEPSFRDPMVARPKSAGI